MKNRLIDLNRLRVIFASPVDPFDAEKARKTTMLNSLQLGYIIVITFGICAAIFIFVEKFYSSIMSLLLFAITFASWIITKTGRIRTASLLIVSGYWIVYTFLVVFSGGMTSVFISWYIVIGIVAGVLLDIHGAIATCIASTAAGFCMVILTSFGIHIPRLFPVPVVSGWFILLVGIYTALFALHIALRDLKSALSLGRKELLEREKAEAALRSSETRFREFVELFPQAVFECDNYGNMKFVNKYAYSLFKYSKEDFSKGLNTFNFVIPEERENAKQRFARVLSGIPSPGNEYTMMRKDGSTFNALIYSIPIFQDNKATGIRGIIIDMTNRKKEVADKLELEKQILHSQKLESLGVLAGGIAHDFNNLLMAITGNLDLALKEMPKDGAGRYSISQAIEASRKAADLVDQMLTYSGKGTYKFDNVDCNRLIRDNTELLKTCISKNTNLRLELAQLLPSVFADSTQLFQVVMNLVMNASEALGNEQGDVTLTTGVTDCDTKYLSQSRIEEKPDPGSFIYLDVLDTGCGMDPNTFGQLFDPFFSTKFTGRGLGMSVVHGIMRSHRGGIIVWSERGKGTLIRLLFPIGQSYAPENARITEPDETSIDQGFTGKTILFVDDDRSICDICSRILTAIGFTVYTAFNGEDGLSMFRLHEREIDCVILDLTMPRMDGTSAFKELKRLKPDVRVILSSGFNEAEANTRFYGQGISGFIQKPYSIRKLENELSRVLGRR